MPKKTTILITILAIITGVLIFFAIRSDKTQDLIGKPSTQQATKSMPVKVPPYATLGFAISPLDLSAATALPSQSVDILLDTHGKSAAGAQVELSYDPRILTNVTIAQPTVNPLFGTNPMVLIHSVDPALGRISYAVGISPTDTEKKGIGAIVTLKFTVNKSLGLPSTQISFLPKSAATTLSTAESILKSSTPLTVILAPSTPAK